MVNIIVAVSNEERCAQYVSALETQGHAVYRACHTGSEVKRVIHQCHDGIVICAAKLADCTADELAWDLPERVLMLVTGKPEQLNNCTHPALFRLASPFSRSELSSAVSMLTQLFQMRLPRRTKSENEIVNQAKARLMESRGLSEPEAHRYVQQQAMDRGMKLTDYAQLLLDSFQ